MKLRHHLVKAVLLASALVGTIVISGCSAHVRYYDEYGGVYHS